MTGKNEEAKTKTKALVVLWAVLLSMVSVSAVAGQAVPQPVLNLGAMVVGFNADVTDQVSQPEPDTEPEQGVEEQQVDYKRLQISPRHEWFQIKPGDEKEFTVKVKNKGGESVSSSSRIEVPSYGEYFLEEEWITVEPGSAGIKAGGEQEYTVTVKIPEDAEIGHYSGHVVFTNDTTPTIRRVLSEAAEKFYLPKTLLSVTWTRFRANTVVVSVLVDPDKGKTVNVWSDFGVENEGGGMNE